LGYATLVTQRVREIEVQNVTRVFGATAALRGVSCSFLPGSITFIQGANGAGKSTLLGIIGTALRPTSGRVLYHPFGMSQTAARRQLGWVGHESHCYRELTGRENVAFGAALHGIRDSVQVRATCERVGAAGFLDQPVSTLSRGQRQRVALARALVHSPDILLLDEPQTGLDAATMERFDSVLHEEKARGAIIIVVSHQGAWAEQWEGVKLTLERGKVATRV
jgi:heme ABC exporter ATP-binding subunit CcmA